MSGATERPRNSRRHAAETTKSLKLLIVQNIERGVWSEGDRLPSERELEEAYGLSRNTLRAGLRQLVAEGLIERHVGRGTFVARQARGDPAIGEVHSVYDVKMASPADVMEVRQILEPAIVMFAALRATQSDLNRMVQSVDRMDAATTLAEFEEWDSALHVAIAKATRNDPLQRFYAALSEARSQPEWSHLKRRSVTSERRAVYQRQHRLIVDALQRRDADAARRITLEHLATVQEDMFGHGGEDSEMAQDTAALSQA